MSALLRQGARRISGAVLRRTQAALTSPAVAEERRRLLPRRTYCSNEAAEELTRKIQQKKEELYDVICKAEQSFWTSSFSNKRLLQHLSVQVEPRQGAKWQVLRFSKWAINAVEIAGLVALSSVITCIVVKFIHFRRDSKEMRAVMREEMRRAREAETRCDLILKARRSDC